MPPQSRSQRRRQNERQQQRQPQQPGQRVETAPLDASDTAEIAEDTAASATYNDLALPRAETSGSAAVAVPAMPAAKRQPGTRGARRPRARVEPEPVDYTKDYQAARRDLRWIAIWAILLFAVMIVLSVSGIV